MNKSAAEVEAEVEAQRGRLDRTVEALKDKMTPGQLFDEASHALGGAGQRLVTKLIEEAAEHPMPFALTGIGLAWLIASASRSANMADERSSHAGAGYGPGAARWVSDDGGRGDGRDHLGAVGDKLDDLKGKTTEMMSGVKDRISDAVSSAGEAGRGIAEDLRAMRGQVADKASRYTEDARRQVSDVFQREPLLLGALGLLVGVAVAAALPPTQAEDQLVGRVRDNAFEKGKALAQDGIETATEAVHAAYGAAKSELDRPGDGDAAQRAGDAVRAGLQAAKSTVSDDQGQA